MNGGQKALLKYHRVVISKSSWTEETMRVGQPGLHHSKSLAIAVPG